MSKIWVCPVCGLIDHSDTEKALAFPNHVPYRGSDIGHCVGQMRVLGEKPPERVSFPDLGQPRLLGVSNKTVFRTNEVIDEQT